MKFDFLINIIFSHEYYNECIPSEIFEIEPRRTNRVVLGGPKYPFRQTGRNQYALIGDREELLDHLSTSPDGFKHIQKIRIFYCIHNPCYRKS